MLGPPTSLYGVLFQYNKYPTPEDGFEADEEICYAGPLSVPRTSGTGGPSELTVTIRWYYDQDSTP